MYTLKINFNLLNKTHKKERLECSENSNKIKIIPDNKHPFSIIISGFSSENQAKKIADDIRLKVNIPRISKNLIPFETDKNDTISIENLDPLNSYSVEICDFLSTDDARVAIEKVERAFIKFMLNYHHGFDANFNNPKIVSDQENIINNYTPLIFKTEKGKDITIIGCGNVSSEETMPSDWLIKFIEETLQEDKILEKKVKLAFDVYRMSFFDDNKNSRFLNLINILEILSSKKQKDRKTIELIDKWENERNELYKTIQSNTHCKQSLDDLKNALKYAKEQSIRSSIYDLVMEELNDINKAEAAKKWYDIRSTLVHEGFYDNEKEKKISYPIEDIVKEILQKKI